MRITHTSALAAIVLLPLIAPATRAADHSSADQQGGWITLFDGKDVSKWFIDDPKKGPRKAVPQSVAQPDGFNPHQAGGYVSYYDQKFSNFVLACDFKVTKDCNSGIFIRTGNPKDPVQSGFEIQIFDSYGKQPSKHTCGAFYDSVAPSKEMSKPAGEWNHIEITADKNVIKVNLNGEQIIDVNLDQYTEPGKNVDGSKNKYKLAIKDFPREGYVGLQNHQHDVWFKNVKIKPIEH